MLAILCTLTASLPAPATPALACRSAAPFACSSASWSSQGPGEASEDKLLSYLLRSPYRLEVFETWYRQVEERQGLAATQAQLTQLAQQAEPESSRSPRPSRSPALPAISPTSAAQVLLARLAATAGDLDGALATLRSLGHQGPRVQLLLARLELQRGGLPAAHAQLVGAAQWDDALLAREGVATLSRVCLAQGDGEGAIQAWEGLIQRSPASVDLRLEVGTELQAIGAPRRAAECFAQAAELSADDVELRVSALAALGNASELALDTEAFAAAWDEVDSLLARGHWRKQEALRRRVRAARLGGRFPGFLAELQGQAEANPEDPGALDSWVRALLMDGRRSEAQQVLRGAAERVEQDRSWLELELMALGPVSAADGGQVSSGAGPDSPDLQGEDEGEGEAEADQERRIALLQALASRHPEEPIHQRHLGEALLQAGKLEGARVAWGRYLAARPEDVAARAQGARLFLGAGDGGFAREMLEQARGLAPGDLDLVVLLLPLLTDTERAEELVEAYGQLGTEPRAWTDWAARLEELGWKERSLELLEEAARRFPGTYSVQRDLAQAWKSAGDGTEQELALWRALHATDATFLQRQEQAKALMAFEVKRGRGRGARMRLDVALAQASDPHPTGARHLWLAELARRAERDEVALEQLASFARLHLDDGEVRMAWVDALIEAKRAEEAMAVLTDSAPWEEELRFAVLLKRIKIQSEEGRDGRALEELQAAEALVGSDAIRAIDLAVFAGEVGAVERAKVLAKRVLRMPGAGASELSKAGRLLADLEDADGALEAFERAFLAVGPGERKAVVGQIYKLLDPSKEALSLLDYFGELEEQVQARPLEDGALWLLTELAARSGEVALETGGLGELLRRDPYNPELLARRSEILAKTGEFQRSLRDAELGVRVVSEPEPEDWARLVELRARCSDPEGALNAARAGGDPMGNAEVLRLHAPAQAVTFLLEVGERDPLDWDTQVLLGHACRESGQLVEARQVYLRALEQTTPDTTYEREVAACLAKVCMELEVPAQAVSYAWIGLVEAGYDESLKMLQKLDLPGVVEEEFALDAHRLVMRHGNSTQASTVADRLPFLMDDGALIALTELQARADAEGWGDSQTHTVVASLALWDEQTKGLRQEYLRERMGPETQAESRLEYLSLALRSDEVALEDQALVPELLAAGADDERFTAAGYSRLDVNSAADLESLMRLMRKLERSPDLAGELKQEGPLGTAITTIKQDVYGEREPKAIVPGLTWPRLSPIRCRVAQALQAQGRGAEAQEVARAALADDWPGLRGRLSEIELALGLGLVDEAMEAAEDASDRMDGILPPGISQTWSSRLGSTRGVQIVQTGGQSSRRIRFTPSGVGGGSSSSGALNSSQWMTINLSRGQTFQVTSSGGGSQGMRMTRTNWSFEDLEDDRCLEELEAAARALDAVGQREVALRLLWRGATIQRTTPSRWRQAGEFLERTRGWCPAVEALAFAEKEDVRSLSTEQLLKDWEVGQPLAALVYLEALSAEMPADLDLVVRRVFLCIANDLVSEVDGLVAQGLASWSESPEASLQNSVRSDIRGDWITLSGDRSSMANGRAIGSWKQTSMYCLAMALTPVEKLQLVAFCRAAEKNDTEQAAAHLAELEDGSLSGQTLLREKLGWRLRLQLRALEGELSRVFGQ